MKNKQKNNNLEFKWLQNLTKKNKPVKLLAYVLKIKMKNKFYDEFTVKMFIVAAKNKKEINKKYVSK